MFYTNYNPKPCEAEKFRLPSETIPDQSLTIAEIVARYVRTGVLPVKTHNDEGGNAPLEDVDPLDLQPGDAISAFEAAKKQLENENNEPSPAPAEPVPAEPS